MYLRYYGLRKTWFDICLKSPYLNDCFTGKTVNQCKHCYNLNDSTVFIFSDHSEGKCLF